MSDEVVAVVEENKALSFSFDGAKLNIAIDPNKNGSPVIEIKVDMAEVPSEVLSLFTKK